MTPETDTCLLDKPGVGDQGGTFVDSESPFGSDEVPKKKITIRTEIPSSKTCKAVRLLPSKTLASFLEKLRQKRILSDSQKDVQVRHVARTTSEGRALDRMDTNLWALGVRDQVLTSDVDKDFRTLLLFFKRRVQHQVLSLEIPLSQSQRILKKRNRF